MKKKNKEEKLKKEELKEEEVQQQENTQQENAQQEESAAEPTLEEQVAELKDKYLRQVAEFENYRKRVLKEKAELILNGGEKVLTEILPVIDDFERAKENIDKATDLESVKEGVDLIYNKFLSYLKAQGVTPIEAVGQPFDTEYHEAIAMVPGQPEEMKGKVMDCVQTGYKLNDKVIRHSKVAVAD